MTLIIVDDVRPTDPEALGTARSLRTAPGNDDRPGHSAYVRLEAVSDLTRRLVPCVAMGLVRLVLRPVGYLAFVVALAALSAAARLLGERDELGFFSARLSRMLWSYPEVTRSGVQAAWLLWAVLLAIALSPIDPILSRWDEVGLAALGLGVAWRHVLAGRQAAR